MFREIGRRMNVTRMILLVMLVAMLLVSAVGITRAQSTRIYAFGVQFLQKVRGNRAYIWTGLPPDLEERLTATPMGISEDYEGYEGWFEAGWATGTDIDNELQQFVAFRTDQGLVNWFLHSDCGDDLLNTDTWYQFKAMYSKSAGRWEAWRFNDVKWFAPYDLGFKKGNYLFVGSENITGGWMTSYAWHPEYKKRAIPGNYITPLEYGQAVGVSSLMPTTVSIPGVRATNQKSHILFLLEY